jgi:hypothetical protein
MQGPVEPSMASGFDFDFCDPDVAYGVPLDRDLFFFPSLARVLCPSGLEGTISAVLHGRESDHGGDAHGVPLKWSDVDDGNRLFDVPFVGLCCDFCSDVLISGPSLLEFPSWGRVPPDSDCSQDQADQELPPERRFLLP